MIVAAWNRADLIARTLDSIAVQTRRPRQVFVVDDASSDTTAAVVRDWIASPRSAGYAADQSAETAAFAETRNAGLRQAETRFAAFLDSDDVWLPDALERMTLPLEQDPDAVVSCADASVGGR